MKTTPGVACQLTDPAPDSAACRFVARWQATPGGRRSLNRAESRMTPLPTASEGKCGTTIRISDRIGVPAARLRSRPAGLHLVGRHQPPVEPGISGSCVVLLQSVRDRMVRRASAGSPVLESLGSPSSSPRGRSKAPQGAMPGQVSVGHRPACRHDFSAGRSPTPRAYRFGKPEYQNRNEDA
jgi:hypothetical protein